MKSNKGNQAHVGTAVRDIMDIDVLFEKGLRAQNHHGNIHYRSIVNERKEAYNSSSNRKNKDLVANQVWERIQGRCLTKAEDGQYYCLGKQEALTKIKQALRDRKRPRLLLHDNEKTRPVSVKSSTRKVPVARRKGSKLNKFEGPLLLPYDDEDIKKLLASCMEL